MEIFLTADATLINHRQTHINNQKEISNFKVVTYSVKNAEDKSNESVAEHEIQTHRYVAKKIAALLHGEYAGDYAADADYAATALYFVPTDTLTATQASMLGIVDATRVFGGSVPMAALATKSITHKLIHNEAAAPPGWNPQFGQSVMSVTLPGYSAFSKSDARIAGERLLKQGEVRIKAPRQRGGNGQTVAATIAAIDAALAEINEHDCAEYGVVLETNLSDVSTRSIGTAMIGSTQISYCGKQFLTQNALGKGVYGGSTLRVVRGDFTALLQLDWSTEEELAIAQAVVYDLAAQSCFDGFFASRRNYDVAQGFDRDKHFCSGVLEQSWRIGGASPAEIAAIEAFSNDRQLTSVRTSCREVHALCNVPDNAEIYFRGADASVGALTKFVKIDAYKH